MTVSRETTGKLDAFVGLLLAENEQQNLISRSTVTEVWSRHIEDSAQLLQHATADARWLDVGSGAGLPGIVLAILGVQHITLVEPRKLRTAFLTRCRDELGLSNADVVTGKVGPSLGRFDVITARAVASIDALLTMTATNATPTSRWVLPKGRSVAKELEEARRTWQGDFRLEPSRTDPDGRIVVASRVRRRMRG